MMVQSVIFFADPSCKNRKSIIFIRTATNLALCTHVIIKIVNILQKDDGGGILQPATLLYF